MEPYFIGIDIGTQGARVVLIDVQGNLVGSSEKVFPLNKDLREEQSPYVWWDASIHSLKKLMNDIRSKVNLNAVVAISVTSTSGTVIPLDSNNEPLHNALMYSDKRSDAAASLCQKIALKYHAHGYTAFNTSSGLAKMIWFGQHFPGKAKKIAKWIHAADYITGKLSECWGVTDYTNAFKSGFDVSDYKWSSYLYEKLPLKQEWLPSVVPSGTVIGQLEKSLAVELGLPLDVKVTAGITDGCASQIASGAMNLGDWNTTIGTTMVIKGVTLNGINDPLGRLYSHRHPTGYWMPGGASNTGADWVTNEFDKDLQALNDQAKLLIPTNHIAYPLRQTGERFPFIAHEAKGFEPDGLTMTERFTANMEGVAYLERYAFEMIENLSGETVKAVFTAGGGSNSETWLTIRSNVMNLPIYKMKHVSGAVGAAILAASKTYFNSIIEAADKLTQIDREVYPTKTLAQSYESGYRTFVKTLQEKGYITKANSDA